MDIHESLLKVWNDSIDFQEVETDTLVHGIYSSHQVIDFEDATINVALSEGQSHLSIFKDVFCEELSFPSIFFGAKRKYNLPKSMSYQEIAKWELKHKDLRFSSCIENLFFKTMKILVQQVLSCVWVRMRKGQLKDHQIRAKEVATDTNVDRLLLTNMGYKDFKTLRTSANFKDKLKRNLFAMIRQLGPASFLITLSSAEPLWEPLVCCLKSTTSPANDKPMPAEIRSLICYNPVITAQNYVHRFNAFKILLKRDKSILGYLLEYFFVTEFQNRGSQHDYGLLWVKEAPVFGVVSASEIEEFMDKHITTNKALLHDDYVNLQTHRHRNTCTKKKAKFRTVQLTNLDTLICTHFHSNFIGERPDGSPALKDSPSSKFTFNEINYMGPGFAQLLEDMLSVPHLAHPCLRTHGAKKAPQTFRLDTDGRALNPVLLLQGQTQNLLSRNM
ncbi:hypothetical protein L7F22_054897 [Adiantum nelumboides]|nr:hypothetical protein [Adiantum nelumboides]